MKFKLLLFSFITTLLLWSCKTEIDTGFEYQVKRNDAPAPIDDSARLMDCEINSYQGTLTNDSVVICLNYRPGFTFDSTNIYYDSVFPIEEFNFELFETDSSGNVLRKFDREKIYFECSYESSNYRDKDLLLTSESKEKFSFATQKDSLFQNFRNIKHKYWVSIHFCYANKKSPYPKYLRVKAWLKGNMRGTNGTINKTIDFEFKSYLRTHKEFLPGLPDWGNGIKLCRIP